MASKKLLFSLLSLLVFSLLSGQGFADHLDFHPTKLFVFGDSYVDTGNTIGDSIFNASIPPYGITSPSCQPSGRFSDGEVLTDVFAKYIDRKEPPIPTLYTAWRKDRNKRPNFGMNFAFGGTGVFDTSVHNFPNMTTQIGLLKKVIDKYSIFTSNDIHSSLAIVSPSGNDYFFYLENNRSLQKFEQFINSVVKQIGVNLKSIHKLGVKKIVVVGLGPIGCYPGITTAIEFKKCNNTMNSFANIHNKLLKESVKKLNEKEKGSPNFFILDMYSTIVSIIEKKGNPKVGARFETPLKPCCFGVRNNFSCGNVDKHGKKMYTLCDYPTSALFWDSLNPTQNGWLAAFDSFKSNLKHL